MAAEVSIVLPSYQRVRYLHQAVDSVRAQTFRDWELIVADDGSDAETAAYLAELDGLAQITVLRLEHSGNPSAVRNAALRAARGRYVAFLDSDDVWLPRKLELQVAVHRAAAACRWSYVAMQRIDPDEQLLPGEPARPTPAGAIFGQLLALEADVSMSAVMAERALLEELGGFDEGQHYFEDFDLFLRLSARSDVSVVIQPLVRMRSHAEHYSADRLGMYLGRARLLDKMRPLAEALGVGAILHRERHRNSADLARVHAAAGRRREALRWLWRAGEGGWHEAVWWRACAAALKSLAPAWVRARYRRSRDGLAAARSSGSRRTAR